MLIATLALTVTPFSANLAIGNSPAVDYPDPCWDAFPTAPFRVWDCDQAYLPPGWYWEVDEVCVAAAEATYEAAAEECQTAACADLTQADAAYVACMTSYPPELQYLCIEAYNDAIDDLQSTWADCLHDAWSDYMGAFCCVLVEN